MKLCQLFAAALGAVFLASPAARADMIDIDCASSTFGFADSKYHLDCQRSSDQVRAEDASGGVEVDVMTISGDEYRVFVTVVGVRVRATRIYMEHRGLRDNFHEAFEKVEAEDWKGIGNKNGYDSAEFTAVISGLPSSCVAIQRYMNPAGIGFKRRVIGMGCSVDGRDAVYTALSKLRSPGD